MIIAITYIKIQLSQIMTTIMNEILKFKIVIEKTIVRHYAFITVIMSIEIQHL